MPELPIYLINLPGSHDRLTAATAALKAQNAPFTRHPAFDGRGQDLAQITQYDATRVRRFMGRALTGGEVGCFISHVEAATRFLDSGAPFGLVLEDDMSPEPDAIALTRALVAAQPKPHWHVAHLGALRIKISTPFAQVSAAGHTAVLHRAPYFPMRTTALLWLRAGAAQFVASAYPIVCPIDIHLRRWLRKGDRGVALMPAPFSTTQAASDIGAEKAVKRGKDSRTALYPIKRAARLITDKYHAHVLKRQASRGYHR